MSLYYNKNAEWELIHSAYGTELKGKRGTWLSPFDGEQNVYTNISVNGREIDLGNHAILVTGDSSVINIEADKDVLCYMFAHREKEMDDYEFEHFWTKEYFYSIWKSRTIQKMFDERRENALKAAQKKREEIRQKRIDKIKAYAEKKKLRMIVKFDTVYLVKIDKRKHKNSEKATDDQVLEFARMFPGNGVEIVEEKELCP